MQAFLAILVAEVLDIKGRYHNVAICTCTKFIILTESKITAENRFNYIVANVWFQVVKLREKYEERRGTKFNYNCSNIATTHAIIWNKSSEDL